MLTGHFTTLLTADFFQNIYPRPTLTPTRNSTGNHCFKFHIFKVKGKNPLDFSSPRGNNT